MMSHDESQWKVSLFSNGWNVWPLLVFCQKHSFHRLQCQRQDRIDLINSSLYLCALYTAGSFFILFRYVCLICCDVMFPQVISFIWFGILHAALRTIAHIQDFWLITHVNYRFETLCIYTFNNIRLVWTIGCINVEIIRNSVFLFFSISLFMNKDRGKRPKWGPVLRFYTTLNAQWSIKMNVFSRHRATHSY